MPDESHRRYLYVAIDRATRWVFLQVRDSQSAGDAHVFIRQLTDKAPFRIEKLLPDNGKAFTDRFSRGGRRSPSGHHPVDRYCQQQGIEHRLIAPGRLQTNRMVERFNGRISDVLATRRYDFSEELETTLKRYNWLYNHQIPQRALDHQHPIQAMKQWQADRPELFHKKVIDHPGPDIYTLLADKDL